MSYPESVYDLLALLRSRGRVPETEIPLHRRNALVICCEDGLIGRAPSIRFLLSSTNVPTEWMLTQKGSRLLAFHVEMQADRTTPEAEGGKQHVLPTRSRPAKAMPSAARESAGSEELPTPQAYPVHVESLSDKVTQLLGKKADNPVSLDEEDAAILRVWDAHPTRRLNLDQIASFTQRPHISRRVVADRVPALERAELITRPRGLRGGYVRTEKGREALVHYDPPRPGI